MQDWKVIVMFKSCFLLLKKSSYNIFQKLFGSLLKLVQVFVLTMQLLLQSLNCQTQTMVRKHLFIAHLFLCQPCLLLQVSHALLVYCQQVLTVKVRLYLHSAFVFQAKETRSFALVYMFDLLDLFHVLLCCQLASISQFGTGSHI